jgi:hypothetical protein
MLGDYFHTRSLFLWICFLSYQGSYSTVTCIYMSVSRWILCIILFYFYLWQKKRKGNVLLTCCGDAATNPSNTYFLLPLLLLVYLPLNQWCTPPLRFQVSYCSTFLIMCDVPYAAVFVQYLLNATLIYTILYHHHYYHQVTLLLLLLLLLLIYFYSLTSQIKVVVPLMLVPLRKFFRT